MFCETIKIQFLVADVWNVANNSMAFEGEKEIPSIPVVYMILTTSRVSFLSLSRAHRFYSSQEKVLIDSNTAPVIHPAVEPMAPRPGDVTHGRKSPYMYCFSMMSRGVTWCHVVFATRAVADYDEAPPEPMPPQPPYLAPPAHFGQFDYVIPPAYRAFYPSTAPSEQPLAQQVRSSI